MRGRVARPPWPGEQVVAAAQAGDEASIAALVSASHPHVQRFAYAFLGWAYFGLKDADNFKKAAGKARSLGHKEPTLLQYLTRIEAGEPIK